MLSPGGFQGSPPLEANGRIRGIFCPTRPFVGGISVSIPPTPENALELCLCCCCVTRNPKSWLVNSRCLMGSLRVHIIEGPIP